MTGPLALVGGDEWADGVAFNREVAEAVGATEVVLLATAAAYEHPERVVEAATAHFGAHGIGVVAPPVLARADASDEAHVAVVAGARLVYLTGRSAMHLRQVVKDTPVWRALVEAWHGGAAVVASSAASSALCEPMVDSRGGAFTVGLALVEGLAVVPHRNRWSDEKAHRTVSLAPRSVAVASIDERAALVHRDGTWSAVGIGGVTVHRAGVETGLEALPKL